MKHLLTAIACFFALSMSAQFPYNPDSNGDNMIGMDDFLDFLPLFGEAVIPEFNLQKQTIDADSTNAIVYEETDWVSIVNISPYYDDYSSVTLPAGTSWKKIFFALDESPRNINFHSPNSQSVNYSTITGGNNGSNVLLTVIRDDEGVFWITE